MADLCWFNQLYSGKFLRRLAKRGGPQLNRVANYLNGISSGGEILRVELDRYLEVAYRHDAMTRDRTRRLRSLDWEVFIQALQEIKAAWYFEQELFFKIQFDPNGPGGRVGEFELIRHADPPIFVEVKSPIRECNARVWFGNDSKAIRSNVKRAASQLPENRPAIVAFCGLLRTPFTDSYSVIDALYGTTVIQVPLGEDVGKPARVTLEPNGLYQPDSNTRISAVVTLEGLIYSPYLDNLMANVLSKGKIEVDGSLPDVLLKYSFKVYHNPHAKHPLERSTFGSAKQFARDGKGYIQWYPQPS